VLDSGAPYLVMEMLEGQSLGDILSERGTLTRTPGTRLWGASLRRVAGGA